MKRVIVIAAVGVLALVGVACSPAENVGYLTLTDGTVVECSDYIDVSARYDNSWLCDGRVYPGEVVMSAVINGGDR